jgi:hypothetical protein
VANLEIYVVEPITDHVRRELKKQLMKAKWNDQVRLYEMTARDTVGKPFSGCVFEAMAQRQLQKEIELDLVPMTRQTAPGNVLPRWTRQDSNIGMSSSTAPNAGDAATTPTSIKFKPKEIIAYDKLPKVCRPDVVYVPNAPNQVGFDSFILHNTFLFVFKMTIFSEHTVKPGIMESLSHTTLKDAQWHFIFVVPFGETTECLETEDEELKEFWERAEVVPLFTAEFDFRKYTGLGLEDQTSAQPRVTHHQGSARDENEEVIPPCADAPAGPSTLARSRQKRREPVVSPERGPSSRKQPRKK